MGHWNIELRAVGCIKNQDYEASLQLNKYYQILPDDHASKHGYLRVVDESGEDYLYPQNYFAPVELIQDLEPALLKVS